MLILGLFVSTTRGAEDIALLPGKISLTGPEARQGVLLLKLKDGEYSGSVDGVVIKSTHPEVATVEKGIVIPHGNGRAEIITQVGGKKAVATVEVKDFERPWKWGFRNHVESVFSKNGCNSGGCHGALAGKGGFRLSLGAYAPEQDFYRLTREALGRRIELAAPGRSLVLTKATTALKHTGGRRIKVGSRDYRVIADWIADGALPPNKDDPTIEKLEVFPPISSLKIGDKQALLVRVLYSDGHEEDVTSWVKFTSANETVATVDENGLVEIVGHGEGAITAWFSSKIEVARVTVPFDFSIPDETFTQAPRKNFVDDLVLDQMQRLNLRPSPRVNDAGFIRRVFLDTIGVLPTPEEVKGFAVDSSPDKRDRLIDHLLTRSEFIEYWSYKWSDLLLVSGNLLRPDAIKAYYGWVNEQIADNVSWDELARKLVTAKGESLDEGATNFFAVHQDPENMAENVSKAFMGLSINCAKCHNHPLEKWTNDQYYAFANLFARVRGKGWGGDGRSGDGKRTLYVTTKGDLTQPGTGKAQPPAPLDGDVIPSDATGDRREALAVWLTSPDNPYFSRAIVNRVWANFMTVGLVEPVDDLRVSNPASNALLLDKLADYLVENDYDLKTLMRVILQSEAYQRSAEVLTDNAGESRYYSHHYPRRLKAEVLYDAISSVTAVPGNFDMIGSPDGSKKETELYPQGTRALQLYDSTVDSYFLKTFGRNEREITCECGRSNQPSMIQVLHIANGDSINDRLKGKKSRVDDMLAKGLKDGEIIDETYLLCLSRLPTLREKTEFEKVLAGTFGDQRRLIIEDLFWAVMSSREFLFQH